jgi:hypothetical protein
MGVVHAQCHHAECHYADYFLLCLCFKSLVISALGFLMSFNNEKVQQLKVSLLNG